MADQVTNAPTTSPAPISCPACTILDAEDGTVDGKLFTPPAHHVKNENQVWQSVLRTQDRVADHITDFAGSLRFVYLHSVWFGIWVLFNIGLFGVALKFDPFPFGLLTMIVSLEAIFLSTFVMVSQNRQAARADLRAKLDFETNLRAEIWAVHIGAAVGLDQHHVEQVVRMAIAATRDETGDTSGGEPG
ncbi:MAG TPA: DUF1003 domain-containing protein [Acidimicrobiales bacterium]|nr:DUF1003 domain-containing protein [Acidimicrobiales bacterium]